MSRDNKPVAVNRRERSVAEWPNPIALDDEAAARMWIESERLLTQASF